MGNTLKNFLKKQRKQRRDDYKEAQKYIHDMAMRNLSVNRDFKEKEQEVFNLLFQ